MDGVFDPAKEVEEEFFGRTRKGCWVHGGRKGVFRAEVYDDNRVKQTTQQTDNQGAFGEERVANMAQAIYDGLDSREAERDSRTTQAPKIAAQMSAAELLKLVGGSSGSGTPAIKDETVSNPDGEAENDEGSDSEDDDCVDNQVHLRSFFGGASAQPKKKAAPTKAAAPASATKQLLPKKEASFPLASLSAQPTSGMASGQVQGEALKLDGRTNRFIENMKLMTQQARNKYEQEGDLELHQPGFDATPP